MVTRTLQAAFALFFLAIGLVGCGASGNAFAPRQVAPDQALIYVYRDDNLQGSAVTLNIEIDGEKIGGLKPEGYLYKYVSPGNHTVSCKTESEDSVEFKANAGETYYVEAEVVMGFFVGRPKLTLVHSEVGPANIAGTKFSGKGE